MVKRATWLSVTPEPERELPEAVATLALGARAGAHAVAQERARIERLVLRGSQRSWLAYLHRVVELIERRSDSEDPELIRARELARAVVTNHHNLLLALPGRGAELTAGDRVRLEPPRDAVPTSNEDKGAP
jgi:hypothetical protein